MSKMPEMCFFCERNYYVRDELKKGLNGYDFDWKKVIRSCEAYPYGIPKSVFLTGHIYPKPSDNGIQFELREGMKLYSHTMGTQEDEDETYHWYEHDIAQGLRIY